MKAKDLTGQVFGKLTAIEFAGITRTPNGSSLRMWKCSCECGNETVVARSSLLSGKTISCGCHGKMLLGDFTRKHGKSKTREYYSWLSMVRRCREPNHLEYSNYGGRGISVCEEWVDMGSSLGFVKFLEDMGECPEGYTLDRIDVNGDYCKENCRWADKTMQSFNQRRSITNTSGRTGVHPRNGKWYSTINYNKETFYLGMFNSFEEAVKAREEAELKYYGFIKE